MAAEPTGMSRPDRQPLRCGARKALGSWLSACAVAALSLSAWPQGARAQAAAAPEVSAAACAALARADLATLADAPSRVLRSEVVAATDTTPAYCRVRGYARASIQFESRLPLRGWNGKHLTRGCGGFCGFVPADSCNPALARGYACTASDMGHVSSPLDAAWAYNNREAELDFSHRATHVTVVVGKALTERLFGRAPQFSYFEGCSTGGRQGMQSTQRYPDDFNGVIAGAPVLSFTGIGLQLAWSVLANEGPDGPILDAVAVDTLYRGAIAECDADDGVRDGVIDEPRACRFDPASVACRAGESTACLTPAQIDVARRIYAGPTDSHGRRLHAGGPLPGSEVNWTGNYIGTREEPAAYRGFMNELFRYLAFAEDPGPTWQLEQLDFDRDPPRLGFMDQLFQSTNPDLRRFRDRGGKLIVWHGWADQSVVPAGTLDYFETMTRTMGGRTETDAFARLFMVPGLNHCSGGRGAIEVDYLTLLEDWVERGVAPEAAVAKGKDLHGAPLERILRRFRK